MAENTVPEEVSRYFSEMGKKGGSLGGKKRAENLSPRRRKQIARAAAKKRWNKS